MLKPDSVYANIKNVKMIPYGKEVYYFLNKKNSNDQIYSAIIKSKEVWHFLTVLTVTDNMMPPSFTNEELDRICDNTKFVIASAYHGEGYLFWLKKEQNP